MIILPLNQTIISKIFRVISLIPDFKGKTFLLRPILKSFRAEALIKFGKKSSKFQMDLRQEYELSIFLSNKKELAVPYVVVALINHFKLSNFFDVGANVGWVSRLVEQFSSIKKIIALEPNKKCFDRILSLGSKRIDVFMNVVSSVSQKYYLTIKPSVFSGPSSFFINLMKIIILKQGLFLLLLMNWQLK